MKRLFIYFFCFVGVLFAADVCLAQSARSYMDLDSDWRFSRGDFSTAMMPAFDDSGWRRLNLPHDWSIEGPFDASYGSGTGYAPGGIGWYRKHFNLDKAHKGRLAAVEFDGIYNNSEVWINGQYVGGRPYGYSSFQCDLTPYLKFGKDENVIAVRVDHTRLPDSRWYTGSGIYRHVRLRITDKLRIGRWGTYVTSPQVNENVATIRIETAVENDSADRKPFSLQSEILAPDGRVADSRVTSGIVEAGGKKTLVQQFSISPPRLWSLEEPLLYTLVSRLNAESKLIDETSTSFGIRTIRFDADKGFFLNGKSIKLKGVCIHHDAGCLGAAVPDKVLERRLRLLMELGVNAIRTSHNPPAPELLDFCDRLGLLVMDEALDEFTPGQKQMGGGLERGRAGKIRLQRDL